MAKHGEHLGRFFNDGKIHLTWHGAADTSLETAKDFDGVRKLVKELYPEDTPARVGNTAGQFWAFAVAMKVGDWVITPAQEQARDRHRRSHWRLRLRTVGSGSIVTVAR